MFLMNIIIIQLFQEPRLEHLVWNYKIIKYGRNSEKAEVIILKYSKHVFAW